MTKIAFPTDKILFISFSGNIDINEAETKRVLHMRIASSAFGRGIIKVPYTVSENKNPLIIIKEIKFSNPAIVTIYQYKPKSPRKVKVKKWKWDVFEEGSLILIEALPPKKKNPEPPFDPLVVIGYEKRRYIAANLYRETSVDPSPVITGVKETVSGKSSLAIGLYVPPVPPIIHFKHTSIVNNKLRECLVKVDVYSYDIQEDCL